MVFVDLRKAYDSVPREALWRVLTKYGVPPVLVNIIKSMHEGMKAEVTIDGQVTPEFEVNNGLRQGCTIAPTLFNLYFIMVIACWRERCQSLGVDILYKCGGKLIRERTRRPNNTTVNELLFADDTAVVSTTREKMEGASRILGEVTSEWRLNVSISKTKLMIAGIVSADDTNQQPLTIGGEEVETACECVPVPRCNR